MENQFVGCVVKDSISTLTINNPPVNALSTRVMRELDEALGELGGAKVVIITGAGNLFSAGADIKELAKISSGEEARQFSECCHRVLRRIETSKRPVIAAINGNCLGGGLELALCCHIRIASEGARLGQPEINLGIIPGAGGTQRLPRVVGSSMALEMLLTGEPLSTEEARTYGLVNRVTKPELLMEEATFLAKRIVARPASAASLIIEAVESGHNMPLELALELESKLFGDVFTTEDSKEGLKAFLEKRSPKFKDK
ncbi:MAG: enoyl-CoA hydratase-related protein [Candidatus Brocadiales bacterium]